MALNAGCGWRSLHGINTFVVEFVNKLLTLQQASQPCKQTKLAELRTLLACLLTNPPTVNYVPDCVQFNVVVLRTPKPKREDRGTTPGLLALGLVLRFALSSGVMLEAEAVVLDAGIGNINEPDLLVAGGDVRDSDTKHLQPFFQLFQGEVIFV